jgi:hypothetical protein
VCRFKINASSKKGLKLSTNFIGRLPISSRCNLNLEVEVMTIDNGKLLKLYVSNYCVRPGIKSLKHHTNTVILQNKILIQPRTCTLTILKL